MDRTRIVFVGVGGMGQMAHLAQYAVLPDCEIVAIVEAREQMGREVAARYGVPRVFANLEDFRAAGIAFDGFVSAQPYRNHRNLMPQLYAFGKPVLSEKPLALSVEAATELAALAEEQGVPHVVGYHKRSDPAMEFAQSLAAAWKTSGKFGPLRYLRATMPAGDWVAGGFEGLITSDEPYPPFPPEPDVAYFDGPGLNQSYDVFVNYYIHQVNALRLLLGEDYEVTYAEATGVLMALRGQSGTPGVLEMSPWNNSRAWQESYLLAFEKGWILVELPPPLAANQAGTVTVYEDNGDAPHPLRWSPELPRLAAMRNQAANYLRFLRGEGPAKCLAAEAVKDLQAAKRYVELYARAKA